MTFVKRRYLLISLRRYLLVLVSGGGLMVQMPAYSQSTNCAPANVSTTVTSIDILAGDTVLTPWTNETPVALRSFAIIDGVLGMQANLSQWAPVAFDSNGKVSREDHDFLEFRIRSSVDNPPVNIIAAGDVVCPFGLFVDLEKNQWESVQIPLASLGLVGQQDIGRLKIKSATAAPFILWVADVRLTSTDVGNSAVNGSPVGEFAVEEVASEVGDDEADVDGAAADDEATADDDVAAVDVAGIADPVNNSESIFFTSPNPPEARFIAWHRDPGVPGEIDDHEPQLVTTLVANGQDKGDDTPAFAAAIEAIAQGGIIDIPAGTYYLSGPLVLRGDNQVLRGAGSENTHLVFTNSMAHGVRITSDDFRIAQIPIYSGRYRSRHLFVELLPEDVSGMYALLTDSESQYSQIVRIAGQSQVGTQTRLLLSRELNSPFDDSAFLQLFDANEYSGVEALSLDVDETAPLVGDMIHMRNVGYGWVRDVVSRNAREAHVFTSRTYQCEITDNLFLDATGHGGGKQGYGVDLANSTTGCLIENNTLGKLRHSIILNNSVNGNIIAFNHSFAPRHTNFANGGPGDISFHNFAYANLIEGNVVERIHIGDSSPVGGGNLIHRNCITSGPLTVDNSPDFVQYAYSNAIYGTDAKLRATKMPRVLPETDFIRPYLDAGATLFDGDEVGGNGVYVATRAEEPTLINNWYLGEQFDTGPETRASYYRSVFMPLFTTSITDDWERDCQIPAVMNAPERLQ